MNFRSLRGGLCLIAAIVITVAGQAVAAPPFSMGRFAPEIDKAVVDLETLEIVITGENLHDGSDPTVTLGGEPVPAPHILDVDGLEVTVSIPPLANGTYALVLDTSMGEDSMDVTISMAGVQVGKVPGWPNEIQCDFTVSPTTGPTFYRLVHAMSPSFGNFYIYRIPGGGPFHDYYYNPDGSYAGQVNHDGLISNCEEYSMQQIIADKRGFFYLAVTE